MSELWRMREQPSRDTREGCPLQATKTWTAKASGPVGGQNKETAWGAVNGRRVDR